MKLHNSIHDVVVVAVVVVVEKVVPNRYNGNELLTDLFIMFRISCNVSSIHSYNFLKASYSFFFFFMASFSISFQQQERENSGRSQNSKKYYF